MICEKTFPLKRSYECLNACLVNNINYLGLPLEGFDIFFGGKGLNLTFHNDTKFNIGTPLYESNFNFLEQYDIPYEHCKDLKPEQAEDFLYAAVKAEQCISIRVSSEELQHSRVFRQTEGAPHYLNILGIDKERQQVYISDGYVPAYHAETFCGWVPFDGIIEAWKRMQYDYVMIEKPKVMPALEVVRDNTRNRFLQALRDYVNPSDESCGIYSANSLFHELEGMFQRTDIREIVTDVNYQLKTFGFLAVKKFMNECLVSMNTSPEIIEEFEGVIERWNRVCLLLMKAGMKKSITEFQKIIKVVEELTDIEKRLIIQTGLIERVRR